jgi:hypothetical protein
MGLFKSDVREENMKRRHVLWTVLLLVLVGSLLLGCGSSGSAGDEGPTEEETSGPDLPLKDPSEPFAIDEQAMVLFAREDPAEVTVQRASGDPLFEFIMKKGGIADEQISVAVQAIQPELDEDLAADYVPVGEYALEMHVVEETGYGFMLRPKIIFHFGDDEIEAAKENGAALDELKGNVLVLYKEQRSPKWVPQRSVSIDEEAKTVTVSNVAGTGAWWLVAVKAK